MQTSRRGTIIANNKIMNNKKFLQSAPTFYDFGTILGKKNQDLITQQKKV